MTSRLLLASLTLGTTALIGTVASTVGLDPATAPTEPTKPEMSTLVSPRTPVSYGWPSGSAVPILRAFDVGEHNWLPGHRGVDLAMAVDDPVLAAADGTVMYAGKLNDRELVSIEHDDGVRTTYEPISPVVKKGQAVTRGEIIGHVADDHCVISSCLHWGAKKGSDTYINPLSLLGGPIRLIE